MDVHFDALFAHLAGSHGDGHVTENDLRSLVFCDFGDPKSDANNYEEVRDVEQLRHVVENYLEEFNSSSKKPMELVLFRLDKKLSYRRIADVVLFLTFKRSDSSAGQKRILS